MVGCGGGGGLGRSGVGVSFGWGLMGWMKELMKGFVEELS